MIIVADIWYSSLDELENQCGICKRTIVDGHYNGSKIWQGIKIAPDRRMLWIRYDTMAPKYQALVRKVLCKGYEPGEMPVEPTVSPLSYRSLAEQVELVLKEGYRRYLGLYPVTDVSRSAQKTQTCLARAAAVVERIGEYVRETGTDERSYAPYKEVVEWLEANRNYDFYFPKGNQYLPINPVRLKEKVVLRFGKPNAARSGVEPRPITDVIHLPRKGNTFRESFAQDAELMAWIAMARTQGTNDPNAYIIRKISEVCRVVGREVPSQSWFAKVLASPKMKQLTADGRFGAGTKQAGRYTHSITMARAMYAGDCWMMDATRVNFIEHQTSEKDVKGFLFVIVVRDAYSGEVVGCHFDTKEDRWGYTNALKMAVKTTGYLPHTLVYDRFPGHVTDEMQAILGAMEAKGVHLVCTHKATGKALLERWFDTLQTVFLTKSRYYYGEGIMSTRAYAHRSAEYLTKVRKQAHAEGWNFDQAWQEAWRRIEEYRQTPVSYYSRKHKGLDLSPATLHEQSEKPNVIPVQVWEQASLFWMTKILDIRRNRIEQEVHGVRYEYPIYDTQIMYRYTRLAIRYEESDPSTIMLFAVTPDDRVTDFFIAELKQAAPIVMYGPDANTGHLAGRQAKIDAFEQQKRADLTQITNAATVDPEYLLLMGGRVPKEAFESVQTAVIYEQMGVVVQTQAQTPATTTKRKAQTTRQVKLTGVPVGGGGVDPKAFVNNDFYNQ